MRILVVSNFYPPARPGGYTQWCHEVTERLKRRGHTVAVLTSRHQAEKASGGEQDIHRLLHLDGDLVYYNAVDFFLNWKRRQQENAANLEQVIAGFAPDIIFVWGMWAMSKQVPALAEHLCPGRVVYYLSDYWPAAGDMHTTYWNRPARRWYTRPIKRVLGIVASKLLASEERLPLNFDHTICVSAAVRDILCDAGIAVQQARVIHGGTDLDRFQTIPERTYRTGHLNLLYAGQLVAHKGVHTAIEALAKIVHEHGLKHVHLSIVGSGHPEYEQRLGTLVERHTLHEHVDLPGSVSKEKMPTLLQQFDVLVFPSVYEEPLARMTQEAMAAGMVVVGTTTGGTKEILIEGQTGLTFAAEDSTELAEQLVRLASDPSLCRRLAAAGRQSILDHFNLERMVDEIDAYLHEVARSSTSTESALGMQRTVSHANPVSY